MAIAIHNLLLIVNNWKEIVKSNELQFKAKLANTILTKTSASNFYMASTELN